MHAVSASTQWLSARHRALTICNGNALTLLGGALSAPPLPVHASPAPARAAAASSPFSSRSGSRAAYSSTPPAGSTVFYDNATIEEYAKRLPSRLSLRHMQHFGKEINELKLIESARYLHKELPVRLAHRLWSLQNLPFIVGRNPYIQAVYESYSSAFWSLVRFPQIKSLRDEERLVLLVKSLLAKHQFVVASLAHAAIEISKYMSEADLNEFLDKMLVTRISRRALAEQHIALHDFFVNKGKHDEGYIGIIKRHCLPAQVVQTVAQSAQRSFAKQYGRFPEVSVAGHLDASFSYIQHHLEYIVLELLKNSMRAVLDFHRSAAALPPVVVTVCKGEKDISIRVSDNGGGIPPDELPKVWNYAHASQKRFGPSAAGNVLPLVSPVSPVSPASPGLPAVAPEDDIGFGLPFARAYAEYLGGSLHLQSMHGYGLDVYLKLSHIGEEMENVRI